LPPYVNVAGSTAAGAMKLLTRYPATASPGQNDGAGGLAVNGVVLVPVPGDTVIAATGGVPGAAALAVPEIRPTEATAIPAAAMTLMNVVRMVNVVLSMWV
jgi:hypothetical protein